MYAKSSLSTATTINAFEADPDGNARVDVTWAEAREGGSSSTGVVIVPDGCAGLQQLRNALTDVGDPDNFRDVVQPGANAEDAWLRAQGQSAAGKTPRAHAAGAPVVQERGEAPAAQDRALQPAELHCPLALLLLARVRL